jgi:hypothetical protein
MKKLLMLFAASLVASLLFAHSFGQGGGMHKGRGGGQAPPDERMYNPQTVETISGVVVSIERVAHMKGMAHGIHAVVKTDKETIPVHLGPSWFIDNQETKIEASDQIEVKGSRIMFEGKPAIIAAQVMKDGQMLTLRNASGVPVWRAWRRS